MPNASPLKQLCERTPYRLEVETSLKLARFGFPPLVIAVGTVAAFIGDRDEPAYEANLAPVAAPAIVNDEPVDGLALGPADEAPELVVLDDLSTEEAKPTPRRVVAPQGPTVPVEPVAVPTAAVVTSEALSIDAPSLALEQPNPRRSIRVDPRRDTARGGISTVSDTGGRRGGFRIGISVGSGDCRPSGIAGTALVFDRGAGLSGVGLGGRPGVRF